MWAKETHPVTFRDWTPPREGHVLKRYKIKTTPGTSRTYRDVTLRQFRKIEKHYGVYFHGLHMSVQKPS